MKKNVMFGFGLAACVAMTSCGHSDYKKTDTGMTYDIISDGKGEAIKNGSLIKFNYKMLTGDSVLVSTFENMPAYFKVDTSMKKQHSLTDILPMMKVGDSAAFVCYVDTLRKMGAMPPTAKFAAGSTIKGYVKIISIFKDEAAIQADAKAEEAKELNRESAALAIYLKENKITATKTAKGAYVQITDAGTGPQAQNGKLVSVLYHGTNLKGKVFDSTKDTTFGHPNKPYEFVLGTGAAIEGWDECLTYFKQGGKGTLYIPAMMAYKGQQASEIIKPFTNLKFDVEVVGVKDAPAAPATMQPPMH